MDTIFIRQLSVPANIGVTPEERKATQNLLIDLEVKTDIRKAASTDDLQLSIDYAALRHSIITYVNSLQVKLVETLAERLAQHLLQRFKISTLCLRVTKKPFDIPDAEGVGVLIERSNTFSIAP